MRERLRTTYDPRSSFSSSYTISIGHWKVEQWFCILFTRVCLETTSTGSQESLWGEAFCFLSTKQGPIHTKASMCLACLAAISSRKANAVIGASKLGPWIPSGQVSG